MHPPPALPWLLLLLPSLLPLPALLPLLAVLLCLPSVPLLMRTDLQVDQTVDYSEYAPGAALSAPIFCTKLLSCTTFRGITSSLGGVAPDKDQSFWSERTVYALGFVPSAALSAPIIGMLLLFGTAPN